MPRKTIIPITICLVVILYFVLIIDTARPLTENEKSLLQTIYGTSVDLNKIRLMPGDLFLKSANGVAIGNIVLLSSTIYSQHEIVSGRSTLVHETCHVWQYQHFGFSYIPLALWEGLTESDAYKVHYDEKKSFLDYDIEEQCQIIASYYLLHMQEYEKYIEEVRNH